MLQCISSISTSSAKKVFFSSSSFVYSIWNSNCWELEMQIPIVESFQWNPIFPTKMRSNYFTSIFCILNRLIYSIFFFSCLHFIHWHTHFESIRSNIHTYFYWFNVNNYEVNPEKSLKKKTEKKVVFQHVSTKSSIWNDYEQRNRQIMAKKMSLKAV